MAYAFGATAGASPRTRAAAHRNAGARNERVDPRNDDSFGGNERLNARNDPAFGTEWPRGPAE
jgi:hypothetical protein